MAAVILIINPTIVIPVADALENAVAPVPVMMYVPDPVMDLVSVPVLANELLVIENDEQSRVPCVSVRAPLAVSAPAKLAIPVVFTVNNAIVLPFGVMVPVPRMVADKVVNVPPDDNVKSPAMFSAVVPGLNAVVPKLNVLNQLPVANDITDVPVPVIVMFGALADVPPAVLPKKTALETVAASVVNPPGPV